MFTNLYNLDMSGTAQWLNHKFLEWQFDQGGRQTLKGFANYLGVKATTLSSWVNSDIDPTGDNVHLLADKLGYEIYDILGVNPPYPPFLHEAKAIYSALSPDDQIDFQRAITEAIKDWLTERE